MSDPLVVIDADVLGRQRTGDETYVENLLRALPAAGAGLRFAAITRRPELVPPGIEPIAEEIFGLPVRVGVPNAQINGLTDALQLPQYSTAIGLVLFGPDGGLEREERKRGTGSMFAKLRNWIADLWN